jgi:riboflavin synthase
MFTGLIEEIGTIQAMEPHGDGARVTIAATTVLLDVAHGDSISVSGVCLTATSFDSTHFVADVMQETINQTTAASWAPGMTVNLERAAKLGDRLGGHIVQGHVDAIGEVLAITPGDKWSVQRVSLSPDIAPLVAHKGSICIDGVSLTVSGVGRDWAEVSLIPETLGSTTLGSAVAGDTVNIETDVLARQVMRLREFMTEEVTR